MSVVPDLAHFGIKHCALLFGCLLIQQHAAARADHEPVFFQAASIPASLTVATALSIGSEKASAAAVPAFTTFAPRANAASIHVLIASHEEAGDFYSPAIAELAEALGKSLQADGQHRAAIAAYDRSFHIMRRQEGLASASQVSILQASIDSQLAIGDMEACDALHHVVLLMQQQLQADNPIALADAHLTAADWNLQYYLQTLQTPVPGGRTDAQDAALAERLGEAFMQYHKALWLLSTATTEGLYQEKVTIERKIAALTLMVDRRHQRDMPTTLTKRGQHSIHQNKRAHHPVLVNHGRAALLRAIDYSVATAEPVLIAERQLELADWYLLMDQHEEARATYVAAVSLLHDAGIPQQQIAGILQSGLPVHDPESTLLVLAGQEPISDFDGYIDVAFNLNHFGKASNTRVLAGAAYDKRIEEDLLRQIHGGRFRPGFDQGTPVANREVTLRYYFAR